MQRVQKLMQTLLSSTISLADEKTETRYLASATTVLNTISDLADARFGQNIRFEIEPHDGCTSDSADQMKELERELAEIAVQLCVCVIWSEFKVLVGNFAQDILGLANAKLSHPLMITTQTCCVEDITTTEELRK